MHIHTGLPIVQRGVLAKIAFNQDFRTDCQVEDCIRNQSNTVNVTNPCRFHSTHNRPRHQCVDVAIREHNETGAQRGNDSILELVGKIRRVEQTQRAGSKDVSTHGLFQFAADKHRALQADVHRRIATPFEPVA